MENTTRCGFVSIIGLPNVGKSSLMNRLMGEKIAIVSPKPQTTRTRITGVYTKGDLQLIFIDTPGVHKPRTALGTHMVKQATAAAEGSDAVMLVVEAGKSPKEGEIELAENIKKRKQPAILAVNKIDALDDKFLMIPQMDAFSKTCEFKAIVPVSAVTGEGMETLLAELSALAEPGPFLFDPSTLTDQPERVLAAEYVREQILLRMRQEIPHGVAVGIENFAETEEGGLEIEATIYCERENHKGMIIGKEGMMLKAVKKAAVHNMKAFFGVPVHLTCWVKVKEDWRNSEGLIRNFGLNNPK